MAGIEDNIALNGDWLPPSPSPRTFFSALLSEDLSSKSILESGRNNEEPFFLRSNSEARDVNHRSPELSSGPEQKSNFRGGLGERIAARAGFNAPRLNTESIRSSDLSMDSEIKSPCWMLPPGLSPTTLLDSPVFLSNSLVQPSPTTGKMPFLTDNLFAFKPGGDMRPTFVLGSMAATTLPPQSFPSMEVSVQSESSLQSHSVEPPIDQRFFDSIEEDIENSPPIDERRDKDGEQRATGESMVSGNGGDPSDNGYNWRKYGQKQVKGSEYPRSYYKCTHPNCQVKKKVERSHEGDITEIIYKGSHNHPKPCPIRRNDQPPSGETDNLESISSVALVGQHAQNGSNFEQGDTIDVSSTFSNDEDEEDGGTREGDESESKRRKIEAYATEMSGASRAVREPRVVVQTTSEVDILDDGYRWRKYGQKVVKGNPNPRSYYKCTNAACTVRKHVERASHDLKSVITTYEGKHNHDVPAARNSSHMNGPAQATSITVQNHGHRPEPARFDRPPAFGPYGIPGRQQVGRPVHGFSYGMNPPTLQNLAMPMVGTGSVLPIHPYMTQHRQGGELKAEPMSEAVYQQIMSRLPLGPHV